MLQSPVSRRAAISHMALVSLIASTTRCLEASAIESAPQALDGEVKAAVMQAFKKAADKSKVLFARLTCNTIRLTQYSCHRLHSNMSSRVSCRLAP